ncbi:Syntaxin-18 [Grifola frondosa]|uniref:Syntaxin-18 n=1 Tax=Grifola frondosa TaxID=5627 RepID=A0A1C7MIH5_GRIFR|nr:Syntaxin-18 [Grifola frondosa]
MWSHLRPQQRTFAAFILRRPVRTWRIADAAVIRNTPYMTASSRTSEFRQILKEQQNAVPEAKRRRSSKRPNTDTQREGSLNKEYLAEAYVILNHITTLTRMLSSIRKPYLNLDSRSPPLLRQMPRTIDIASTDQSWSNIRHLTNEERDQIDLQARVILSRCADRVREMEALEKRRAELDDAAAASDFVAAHHASITWYLGRRLAEVGQGLKEMQEERMRRQLERTRTLGSGAAREALYMGAALDTLPSPAESSASGSGSWLGGATSLASSFAASIGGDAAHSTATLRPGVYVPEEEETDEEELELSASQIEMFETENANILQSVQDTLASVQQAESRLLEISALQMELVAHLTKQTEQTEQLYEDAITTAATVEKGNAQLKEAKRRARDSRKWILLFLIGASLSLLFLHYY